MNNFPNEVKTSLEAILSDMADHYWLFCNNPGHDFIRQNGKLSFLDTIKCMISMGKDNLDSEIMQYFDYDEAAIPTASALIQRRKQINSNAFPYLFSEFTNACAKITHSFKDHCILAADGTHVVYSTNAQIIEDYNKPRLAERKGYNHMHLNGFVDVISKAFLDVVIQPGQAPDEREALHIMLDHFQPDHPQSIIITADRGYESYDLMFHCLQKSLNYVFRVKSPNSGRCILASFKNELLDDQDEFDVTIRRFFTDKKSNIIKEQDKVYLYLNPNKNIPHFYGLLQDHLFYHCFRIVKIKTGDGLFEYLITNLPSSFNIEDLKVIYHYRWGCETAFRYLKHAAALLSFHSKKPDLLYQEVYARLIAYNFGIFIANEASSEKKKNTPPGDNKYVYEIDFSQAIKISRHYFARKSNRKPMDVIKLICKYVHAVKTELRNFPRSLRGIGAIHFNYR